jgi:hypothetical protein
MKAMASEMNSPAYKKVGLRIGQRALTKMASSTLARMAKNASALTSQVVPNSRLKLTMLRVSSSRNATPSTKKCGLNRRIDVPVARAPMATAANAPTRITPSARR